MRKSEIIKLVGKQTAKTIRKLWKQGRPSDQIAEAVQLPESIVMTVIDKRKVGVAAIVPVQKVTIL